MASGRQRRRIFSSPRRSHAVPARPCLARRARALCAQMLEIAFRGRSGIMRNTAIVERIFRADPESVYSTYWQLKLWPKVLRNILEVQVDYDDGVHQYFSMVVANDRDRETVRGVRIGTPYLKLELCQLSP